MLAELRDRNYPAAIDPLSPSSRGLLRAVLRKGQWVIVSIVPPPHPGSPHAVVLIGVTEDDWFQYLDPAGPADVQPRAFSEDELVQQWTARDAAAREKVETVLALAGQTVESVSARTLAVWVGDLERLERMITSAEGRRHAALRELERHRETLARSLRRAVADVEDAEYKVIAPEPPAQEAAA